MTPVTTRVLSAEEFFDLPFPADGSKQELVRGEVRTMPSPGLEHGEVQGNVLFVIKSFLKANPIGRVMVESGTVTERKPDTVRGPDVSYYSSRRLPLEQRVVKYHDQVPDLCVEVVSPSNSLRQLKAKAKEYLFAGVLQVWIVDPEDRSVTVVTEPLASKNFETGATLHGGDILPGFSCKVADLFA
ncbi:MAG TPA: Uma2 family endonuclease [Urbifossiella sp.]|jgi:Uma2 family endonuclease|nr:Uma2 family endonuclease [Urbifossiella sp.]